MLLREPFESMERWRRKGRRFAVAELVRAGDGARGGAGPRDPGALMAVSERGDVAGSVSGGCVEGAVIEAALQAIASGQARTLVFSEDEGAASPETYGLDVPCGGGLKVRVQPCDDDAYDRLRAAWRGPRPRIVCVGAVHVAEALCRLAREVGYKTIVVDPRRTFTQAERITQAADTVLAAWPQDVLPGLGLGGRDAVCALTHDAKIDTPALASALATEAGYIGCLGHAETLLDRREALIALGVEPKQLARVHGPIGLFLGGREPEEIALSALAQIQAVRCGRIGHVAELPGCTLDAFTPEHVGRIGRAREEGRRRGERLESYLAPRDTPEGEGSEGVAACA